MADSVFGESLFVDGYLFVVTTHIHQRAREFSGVSFLRDIVPEGLHPMTWLPPKAPLLRAIGLGVRILIPKSETYSVCNRDDCGRPGQNSGHSLWQYQGQMRGREHYGLKKGEILASRRQMPKSEGIPLL